MNQEKNKNFYLKLVLLFIQTHQVSTALVTVWQKGIDTFIINYFICIQE